MRPEIHGLGWFVRRSAGPEWLGAFYRDRIGFPELRRYGTATMLWLGETVDFEIAAGGNVQGAAGDAATAPCVPYFEVRSLDQLSLRLERDPGIRVLAGEDGSYFVDPSGNLTGLLDCSANSGEATVLDGVPALPEHFLRLGEIVRRCRDVEAIAAFYRDVVGLDAGDHRSPLQVPGPTGGRVLSLGATATLDIAPGGAPLAPVHDRQEASNLFVIRVDDVDGVAADLVRQGVRAVNMPFGGDGGKIGYFADPEEQVFGIQTRLPESTRVEDHEARRREKPGR